MVSALALALSLHAGDPTLAPIRAELSSLAAQIEQLKARRVHGEEVGRDLERLLVRAQDLAAEIERHEAIEAAPALVVPTARELRERADFLRDEADVLAAALAALDIRIEDARRAAAPAPGMARAAIAGAGGGAELARVRALLAERGQVASRLAAVRGEVAVVEEAARRAELEEEAESGFGEPEDR